MLPNGLTQIVRQHVPWVMYAQLPPVLQEATAATRQAPEEFRRIHQKTSS
jgi:hypothetical protein